MARNRDKYLIITADDLGIDEPVNRGIIESYASGILTSSALLMNAPSTEQGIRLAMSNPGLEVGLHLSIVEGLSLRGKHSTVTDNLRYFNDQICLIRDWKAFFKKYFTSSIDYTELREELELQFRAFSETFGTIPFVNGTQHLHLMPKVFRIVRDLAVSFGVHAIRLPGFTPPNRLWVSPRFPLQLGYELLGELARMKLRKTGIKSTDLVHGMQFSGRIDIQKLEMILSLLRPGVNELVIHPGYKSTRLITDLPGSYSNFHWDVEREALTSEGLGKRIEKYGIKLIRFADL